VSESTRSAPASDVDPRASWTLAMAEHEALVHWVVRRQDRRPLSYADAVHEGRIGLWQALRGYDPRRGTRFSTYAVPAITHALWQAVATARATSAAWPTAAPPRAVDADAVEQLQAAQVHSTLRALVHALPPPLRHIVTAHAGLEGTPPQTFAALGHELGVSRQRVHQRHGAALAALAHPSASLPLRRLLGRDTRVAYQHTLARPHRQARARRRGVGGGR
jgi:RNA polymerase sigma factor (sigma-70 family)